MLLLPLVLSILSSTTALASQLPLGFQSPSSSFHPSLISSTVELGGSLVRTLTSYTLDHDGGESNDWTFALTGQTGFVEAKVGQSGSRKLVELNQVAQDGDVTWYTVSIPTPSDTTVATLLTLSTVTSNSVFPKPRSLPQRSENVLLQWEHDLSSVYAHLTPEDHASVTEIKIKVKTPTPGIGGIMTPDAFELNHSKGSAIVVFTSRGPLADLEQGPQHAAVHFQQPTPVTTIRNLDRLIEVSHWGANLAVQDNIDLVNSGPKLEGHFSRIDHQRITMSRRASAISINSLSIVLPPSVSSPYYYDLVGNVSTSRFRPSPPSIGLRAKKSSNQHSLLELIPRYPIMGGWNYTFTIGYDAPLQDFVKRRENGEFVLAVPFLTPIKDVGVDEVKLTIRLPEGAKNLRVHLPFPVDSQSPAGLLSKTYLDSVGRPTVVLTKSHCSDRHGGEVIIEYTLSPLADLFQKPLAIATVLSTLFLVIVLVKRLDWNIAPKVAVAELKSGEKQ